MIELLEALIIRVSSHSSLLQSSTWACSLWRGSSARLAAPWGVGDSCGVWPSGLTPSYQRCVCVCVCVCVYVCMYVCVCVCVCLPVCQL